MNLPEIVNIRVPVSPPPTHQAALRILKNRKTGAMFVGKMSNSKASKWAKDFEKWLLHWTPPKPIDGPLLVSVNFAYPLLAKHRRYNGGATIVEAKITRPDCDNLVKSVLDCLVRAKYIVDDSNVVSLAVTKWYHWKGPFVDVIVTKDHPNPWASVDHPTPE
jgi:Holliday junction resolvase RusA-like endonuclease